MSQTELGQPKYTDRNEHGPGEAAREDEAGHLYEQTG